MKNDVPVQVIVAAFNDEHGAEKALQALKEARKEKLIGIQDAAILRRDAGGKLHIKETADMRGGKGAVIGGVAAKLRDSGFPDERLKMLGKALTPGTSAIIAVIEHRWVAEYEQALAEYGADVVTQAVEASIAAQLETTASAGTGSTQPKGTQS